MAGHRGEYRGRRGLPWGNFGSNRGLTLLEILLALIMLSLLIVGVLGLLGSLLVSSTKSTDSTVGSFVAQNLLDRGQLSGPPQPDGGVVEGTEQRFSHEEARPVNFRYRMTWTKVAPAATYRLGTSDERVQFGPDLFHAEVIVWWMVENAEDGRTEGGGKRRVRLERLISFERVEEEE